ncbi:hypothetical protein BDN71DRAFT_1482434 [Pleurotus eryngii]|uniref:Integrase core domain-containing protein n=1 Tax=Pleurotus eryngii TaxID=5323 RepID=A0A9P6D7M2_PLEER|nr:hypothetical protein BDN71DRAFT_1482434 [Pleurotus eryngii]
MLRNQHKPNSPIGMIEAGIRKFYRQGLDDQAILSSLKDGGYYDMETYGLGIKKFRKLREQLGLVRSRKACLEVEDIRSAMILLRNIYPRAGLREMKRLLQEEHNLAVRRSTLSAYFLEYEPELVQQRRSQRFRRKRFWAAGIMDMLCCDQHDKWKRFGLRLHNAVDLFIGKIHWIKIWHTNSNPMLITSYYLDDAKESGHIPLIAQSDPGSENFGIAKAHTFLWHWHDPDMNGYLCHRWMKEKKNIPPEISWSQLRQRFTPGFENILDKGVHMGWYNIDDTVHKLTFRWVFIPWLQDKLDAYRSHINSSRKRRDRNKILPHGVPDHMEEFPELYGALNFKVKVQAEVLAEARALYAPPDHLVFTLVPLSFENIIHQGYRGMGSPTITRDNVWETYRALVRYIYAELESRNTSEDWAHDYEMAKEGEGENPQSQAAHFEDLEPLVDIGTRYQSSHTIGHYG